MFKKLVKTETQTTKCCHSGKELREGDCDNIRTDGNHDCFVQTKVMAKEKFRAFANFKKLKYTQGTFQTTTPQAQAMACMKENVDEKVPLTYGHSNPGSLWEDNVKSAIKKMHNVPRENPAMFKKSRPTKSSQARHEHRPVGGSRTGCEKGLLEEVNPGLFGCCTILRAKGNTDGVTRWLDIL